MLFDKEEEHLPIILKPYTNLLNYSNYQQHEDDLALVIFQKLQVLFDKEEEHLRIILNHYINLLNYSNYQQHQDDLALFVFP